MDLYLSSFNARGLRNASSAASLLKNLLEYGIDVAALQETNFTCPRDERVFENDYVVYSAYTASRGAGVSLLVKRSLNAVVNLLYTDTQGRLLVADLSVNGKKFRVATVHAPNKSVERRTFFRKIEPYLADPLHTYLVGDWNAILDPNLDRGGRGGSGRRCENKCLRNFMAENDLVDRYRVDHPGGKHWTWTNFSSSSVTNRAYLDRMLVRRADLDFLSCPEFKYLGRSDHKLVMARLRLSDRPKMATYWKLNSSLLELEDFRKKLGELVQRELVGVVTGNKWYVSLKHKIRTFAVKYSQQLALDKATAEKSIEDKLHRAVSGGDTLSAALARADLVQAANDRYNGQVVRSRLDRVSNEAVKLGASMRAEEFRRQKDDYITEIKNPDGRTLRSTRDIVENFRTHLQSRFTRLTDLPVEQFDSYLADFPRLEEAEATCCEGTITECEVVEALKQVKRNKSPGLDGLPYEMYLQMSHMFVPILTVMFNHWFNQGGIPGQVTRGVITLIKKGKGVGGLDDYRPITLLNTDLKILARVLSNRLRIVIEDLVCPEQTYAIKGRKIHDNLHMIRQILEKLNEDDTGAALINLDQSKAFDRVDHRFLEAIMKKAGFKSDFLRWINLLYKSPSSCVQVNGKRSRTFPITRSVRQGCPLSPLLYVLALEPLLRRLNEDGVANRAPRGEALTDVSRARASAYADDVSVFVFSGEHIRQVHQVLIRYQQITGSIINCSKSSALRLGGWRGGTPLPALFDWTDGPIRILGIWFGPDLQLEKNWMEVRTKVGAAVDLWLRRKLSLKGRAEACACYVFPLILYRLAVLPLPADTEKALEGLLFKLLWKRGKPLVRREACIQRIEGGGLGMPHLASHKYAERLSFISRALIEETAWTQEIRDALPEIECSTEAERRRRPRGQEQFLRECRQALRGITQFSDLASPRNTLYRGLVVGFAKDPQTNRPQVSREDMNKMWNWAPGRDYLNNSEFSLTWRVFRNALPLNDRLFHMKLAEKPDCERCCTGLKENVAHAFYECNKVQPMWERVEELTERSDTTLRVPIDMDYVINNKAPPWNGEKEKVFRAILAVARLVVWITRCEEKYHGKSFSSGDLVLFFEHQLRIKIRCDKRRLSKHAFFRRWIEISSLVAQKGERYIFTFVTNHIDV